MFLFTTYITMQLWLLAGATIVLCGASFLLGKLFAAQGGEQYPDDEFAEGIITTPLPKPVFQALDSIVWVIGACGHPYAHQDTASGR